MARSLRKRLSETAGFGEVKFEIPHIFLPPRFQKISQGRDMILVLDLDLVVHVHWENTLLEQHRPLTLAEARRLFRECTRNMQKYRGDLSTFARFVDRHAEEPFWDPRKDSAEDEPKKEPTASIVEEGETGDNMQTQRDCSDPPQGQGGEIPIPLEFSW